jgi:hypothetical protein
VGHPEDSQGNELDICVVKNITDYHCECEEGSTGVWTMYPNCSSVRS